MAVWASQRARPPTRSGLGPNINLESRRLQLYAGDADDTRPWTTVGTRTSKHASKTEFVFDARQFGQSSARTALRRGATRKRQADAKPKGHSAAYSRSAARKRCASGARRGPGGLLLTPRSHARHFARLAGHAQRIDGEEGDPTRQCEGEQYLSQ